MVTPFVLIVTDRIQRVFCVEGPMTNDDRWHAAAVEAQNAGRQVNCHLPGGPAQLSVEAAADAYAREYGYRRVPAGSIIPRPKLHLK